jgi:hypothetical protein
MALNQEEKNIREILEESQNAGDISSRLSTIESDVNTNASDITSVAELYEKYFYFSLVQTGTSNPVVTEIGGSQSASEITVSVTRDSIGEFTVTIAGLDSLNLQLEFVRFTSTASAVSVLETKVIASNKFIFLNGGALSDFSGFAGLTNLVFKVIGYKLVL